MISKNIFFNSLLLLTGNFFASQNLHQVQKQQEEDKAPLHFLFLVKSGEYSQAAKFLIAESVKKDLESVKGNVDAIKKKVNAVTEERCPIQ